MNDYEKIQKKENKIIQKFDDSNKNKFIIKDKENNENNILNKDDNINEEINKNNYDRTINKDDNAKFNTLSIINKETYKNIGKKNIYEKLSIESKDKISQKGFTNGKTIFTPIKTKKLFSFSNPRKKKPKKLKNILYKKKDKVPVIDKEGLIVEILQSQKQIELMDIELFMIKKKRKRLEQKFLANKLMIEGILDIKDDDEKKEEENNNISKQQFTTENNNVKLEVKNTEKENEHSKSNKLLVPSTKINFFRHRNNIDNNAVIFCLKKQIDNCDKSIEDKQKLMEIKQNENRVNNFLKLNSSIEEKNKTLEELVNKSQTLQYIILDIETRIEYFTIKIKNYIDETKKLYDLINNNNVKSSKKEKEIQSLNLEKEELLKKIKALEDDEKYVYLNNEKKKKERQNVENELKETKNMINEKNNNEKEIIEIGKNEILLKRNVDKNDIVIQGLSNEKNYSEKKIEKYKNEKESLNEKIKLSQKSREKQKRLENEIKILKKEFEDNKNLINNHEKTKNHLSEKIDELTKELKIKKEENKKIEEELHNIKKIYKNKVPKDFRKLNEEELNEDSKNEEMEEKKEENKKNCLVF